MDIRSCAELVLIVRAEIKSWHFDDCDYVYGMFVGLRSRVEPFHLGCAGVRGVKCADLWKRHGGFSPLLHH